MRKVVVIGQGYVGLPLSEALVEAGFKTVGLDLNRVVVDQLNSGNSHVDDISDHTISSMIAGGYLASCDDSVISDADVIVICVPTPLSAAGGPDLGAVEAAVKSVAENLRPGCLVVLESTTYPGTTENLVLPILEAYGHTLDTDFFLAFSPERIDPGNKTFGLKNTPKVVGGASNESTQRAVEFYSCIVDTVVQVKGTKEAETAKLLENTYRHINIALMNEMAKFCHELDIDLWEVIRAAKTKPFGFQAFYPGPGVGGHCIPIDPNYLSFEVERNLGYPFRFVELAQEINNSMPRYVVDRLSDALNSIGLPVKGTKVLLLGVTYKADISDQRESPAVHVDKLLRNKGADVIFHDPHVKSWVRDGLVSESESDLASAVAAAQAVVLLQNHSVYDVDAIAEASALFFDTRGVTAKNSIKL
ncbi:nucleotide sugar dehydrogenase [Pseudarthrobacter enclensis]|uniref:Nucleotide sugar dehydrogenase n=1 Tax=Pseudarthrobacter enclensis TaxID=993070 RepID=A0ABT9RX44_9MICC|nr:nucleotide sugar dehydrogenase [Pseudarthrobacter enclensis]MDP9889816.1 nucleotide sugar dehydrogenase [Pseudarthrobacter enclensis]